MKTKLLVLGALFASLCISAQGQLVDKTPVLHLSFDSVSGTTVNNDGTGGSGMNGTLNGGATIVGGGKFGNALQVTGTASPDASVRVNNAVVPLSVTASTPWTVSCWIKSTTQGGTWMYQGAGGWGVGNTTFAMLVNNGSVGNNGHAAGGVRNSSGWLQGTTVVDDGNWHHIVVTWDGTTKIQYVDGVVDTWVANQWGGSTATGTQFWIGGGGTGQGDGQVCLNGLIDEAYVFNQALTAADVQNLFTANALPIVPVTVTVSPNSGYRGTVFTVTATATPASGTVTNCVANLSALGLSASTNLVQKSPNVFTNTFTIPNNAAFGAQNVKVTVIDTEPLIGSGGNVFTVVPLPPTNAIVVQQLGGVTNFQEWVEASFTFRATNDAPNAGQFNMIYSWYRNTVLVSSNMGPNYTFLTTPADNGTQIYAIGRVNNTNFSSIAITSSVVTLTLTPGTPSYTNGLKQEVFAGVTSRAAVYLGNTPRGNIHVISAADSQGGFGDNTSRRYSGWFIPKTTDNYVFFVASDDDSDVFLSTDSSPANKRLICQEQVWSAVDNWQTPGQATPGPFEALQKRSDTWSPDPTNGVPPPWTAGIPLVAGNKYYFESVEHNGTGGDSWAVTYETMTELGIDASQPVNASVSRMTAVSNNIVVTTWPGTVIAFTSDLSTTLTNAVVLEGGTVNYSVTATNDSEMATSYQWYLDGVPFPGATGTSFLLTSIPLAYNGSKVYAVARPDEGSLVITSRVSTLTVNPAVHEAGFVKDERWDSPRPTGGNWNVNDIINSNIPLTNNFQMALTEWGISTDNAGGHNDFIRRVTGFFKPTVTGQYTFFVTSDDDSILFLSTDNTPGHKRQVASQGGWNSGGYRWGTANGGGNAAFTTSDTFAINGVVQNPAGITLTAGQTYYMEQDMHQGGGGANLGATFTLFGAGTPASGTKSALNGSVIETLVPRSTNVTITVQPHNVANALPGSFVGFSAAGTTDSQVAVGGPIGYEEVFQNNKLFFQWFTNGVLVGYANTGTLLLGPVTAGMVGMPVMCQMRSLGYVNDAFNPIWTNSTTATITSVGSVTYGLKGHWLSGAASLADTANVVGPGVYDAIPRNGTNIYMFTNDVPPTATAGAQSLFLNNQGLVVTNTSTVDPGYVTDTFDSGLQTGMTVMFWAKGWPGAWNPWVSKAGDNGTGWQLRPFNAGPTTTFTMRGTGGVDDFQSSIGSHDGKWHHYAGTWDGTNFIRQQFVDGALVATDTGSTPFILPSPSHLMIGARDAGGANFSSYFTGNIYDVRIYNTPLAQTQIIADGKVPPPFAADFLSAPGSLLITWPVGTLLEATNILGPWTTSPFNVSPATIPTTGPQKFFRISNP